MQFMLIIFELFMLQEITYLPFHEIMADTWKA